MRKLNLVHNQTSIIGQQKFSALSPWNQNFLQQNNKTDQNMSTHRRQIVQNFLGRIKSKKRRDNMKVKTQGSCSQEKQKYKNLNKKQGANKFSCTLQSCIEQIMQNKKDRLQDQRIFKQQCDKRKKSKLKLKVVNLGDSFQVLRKRQSSKQYEQNKRKFMLKLRIKQDIVNSKNSVRNHKKYRAATVANIFKNQFLQCQLSNYQQFPLHSQKFEYPTFFRLSTSLGRKRSSNSEARAKTRANFY